MKILKLLPVYAFQHVYALTQALELLQKSTKFTLLAFENEVRDRLILNDFLCLMVFTLYLLTITKLKDQDQKSQSRGLAHVLIVKARHLM